MIGGMGGRETEAAAALYYFPDKELQRFIIAWPHTLHQVFDDLRTDIVAENKSNKKKEAPYQALLLIGGPHPYQQKKINRCPEIGYAQQGHQRVEKRIAHAGMHQFKQVEIDMP